MNEMDPLLDEAFDPGDEMATVEDSVPDLGEELGPSGPPSEEELEGAGGHDMETVQGDLPEREELHPPPVDALEYDPLLDLLPDPELFWSADCAISVEQSVLRDITGQEVSASELRDLAVREAWFDPESGMIEESIATCLEHYGVSLAQDSPSTLTGLCDALDEGRVLIAGFDLSEIVHAIEGPGGAKLELADHHHLARVEDIRGPDDDGNCFVVLDDPSRSGDSRIEVLSDDFLNAWVDCKEFCLATEPIEGRGRGRS